MNRIINKMPDWLRWLLLVPAIVCYAVASAFIVWGFLMLIGETYWGSVYVLCNVISLFLVTVFVIQIAANIAPKGKLLVASIFAALIFIFFVIMAIKQGNIDIFDLICISGPIAGFIVVKMNMCSKLYRRILNLKERIATIKRTPIFWAVCILLLIAAAVGIFMYIDYSTDKTAALFINGKEITNVSATIHGRDAVLPFTEVLKGFGFNIEWLDNDTANVTCKDKKCILDLKNVSFEEEGNGIGNLLDAGAGGGFYYCKAEGREVFIDDNTINGIMYDLGKKISIKIDRDKLVVYVDKRID